MLFAVSWIFVGAAVRLPGVVFDRCIATFLAPGHPRSHDALDEMREDFVARRETIVSLCGAYDAALPTFLASLAGLAGPSAKPVDIVVMIAP